MVRVKTPRGHVLLASDGSHFYPNAYNLSPFRITVSAPDTPTAPVEERPKAASSTATFALKPTADAMGVNVRFSYMNFTAMNAALATGAIRGFMASAPFYATPVVNGTGVIWLSGQKGEFDAAHTPANYSVMNTPRAFAEANPRCSASRRSR